MIKISKLSFLPYLLTKVIIILAIWIFICDSTFSREIIKDLNIPSVSYKGTVIVLEAPLFEKQNIKSRILQYVRKGDTLFINGKGQIKATYDIDFHQQFNSTHGSINTKIKAGRSTVERHQSKDTPHLNENFYRDFYSKSKSFKNASELDLIKDLSKLEEAVEFQESIFTGSPAKKKEVSHNFFKTIDNIGRTAYILKDHVKVLYKDTRELRFTTNLDHDSTDYRLEEPLPKNYPFVDPNTLRLSISYGSGPGKEVSYPYPRYISYQDYSPRQGLSVTYTQNITFDPTQRLYFGGILSFVTSRNTFTFYDDGTSQETINEYSLGPVITFDSFRTQSFRLALTGAITLNYSSIQVEQTNIEQVYSSRRYHSFYITPKISTNLYWQTPMDNTSILVKGEVEANAPYDLEDYNNETDPAWNEHNDKISMPAGGNFTLYCGLLFQI